MAHNYDNFLNELWISVSALRRDHEESCEFALIACPNSATQCGQIRQCQLNIHMKNCHQYPCHYKEKGNPDITVFLGL
jgi:hypothetical protein